MSWSVSKGIERTASARSDIQFERLPAQKFARGSGFRTAVTPVPHCSDGESATSALVRSALARENPPAYMEDVEFSEEFCRFLQTSIPRVDAAELLLLYRAR